MIECDMTEFARAELARTAGDARDYGVGVDTERVARWRELLPSLRERQHRRLFTEQEHQYCESFPDSAPVYAGSWCAKEAVFKAVARFGVLTLDQIEIERLDTGRPSVRLPLALAQQVEVQVSISHDAERAVAFAVAVSTHELSSAVDVGSG
jgi:phosphopantetheine--protein transferase-like protein